MSAFADLMTPFAHTVAAYLIAIGLVWGYAVALWLSSRRGHTNKKRAESGARRDLP